MAYTTSTIVTGSREERGPGRWRIVVTHAGAAVAPVEKEYQYSDDEDLKRQVVAQQALLNAPAATVTTGVLGAPTPGPADPAGVMRSAIETVNKIARLEALRANLALRVLAAGANPQAAGATITAGQVTNWTTFLTDVSQKIDALKQGLGTQYAAATAPQKLTGLDNL